MSTASEQARAAAKSKVEKLVRADPTARVDASGYKPDGALNGDVAAGMRPVSRRAFKKGGKVEGHTGAHRADRKPRASGGSALTANSLINRNVKDANEERGGITFRGGLKTGGAAHGSSCDCAKCSGGRVGRASGGSAKVGHAAINNGTRPVGGRLARKGGGRTKGKTNINIVIAPQGGARPMPSPIGAGPAPGAPVGMRQGVPPPPAAPPAAAMPPQQPMMRKSGGRTLEKDGGKLVKPGAYPIETGGGGGLARLEKAQRAKRVNP